MAYLLLKWLHVIAAIVAVGSNVTYGLWIANATRKPEVLPFTLKTIKLIDDRLANPCYAALLLTGGAMLFVVRIPLTTSWLVTSLVLYVLLFLLGVFGYSPTLRQQIDTLEREGVQSANYQALARRGTSQGVMLAVLVMLIVFLMVVKPRLWS